MATYSNFQQDKFKYNPSNQTDIYNPQFNSTINVLSEKKKEEIKNNLDKFYYLCAYWRFYPDRFLDMMTPEDSKYRLNLYQRVMLRALFRFKNNYVVISRGSGKTFTELLALILKAIMYPNIKLAVSAESKEQASKILMEKFSEITTQWYPFLQSEIVKTQFGKDYASITFQNGSVIDVIGAIQSSKGLRRNQGSLEESARMNNFLFKDVIEPIFNIPRRTASGAIDKKELHGALNFFTTSGYRGSEEWQRNINMVNDMANCKGSFVFGADWKLPTFYGLSTKAFVMGIKDDPTTSITAFKMNYCSEWVGASQNALVAIDRVLALRVPELQAELRQKNNEEYIISVDVARSKSESNNKTAIVVGKINRGKDKSIKSVDLVNIVVPPAGLNFTQQSIIIKQMQKAYNAQICVIDANGVGSGLADRVVEDVQDPMTGVIYDAWDCINDDTFRSQVKNAPKILYAIKSTGINTNIIVNFWDYVETFKLRLLPEERNAQYLSYAEEVAGQKKKKSDSTKLNEMDRIDCVSAHMRTDLLLEQLSNLEIDNKNKQFIVNQVTKSIDKDIYSALVYMLYVVQNHLNVKSNNNTDYSKYVLYN